MEEARKEDEGRLPVYQWLASYAYANSRLSSAVDDAALILENWRTKYLSLSEDKRRELLRELRNVHRRSTQLPLPRHMILAKRICGEALAARRRKPNKSTVFGETADNTVAARTCRKRRKTPDQWIQDPPCNWSGLDYVVTTQVKND